MNADLRDFENQLERRYARLSDRFDAPESSKAFFDDLVARVGHEASRLNKRRNQLAALRPIIGLAAAFTLILTLNWPTDAPARLFAYADPESSVADWFESLDATETQFTALFNTESAFAGYEFEDDEYDAGGYFDSLEESFESFDEIIGA